MVIKKSLFLIMSVFIVAACVSHEVIVDKPPEMYWPLPPEKPRIKFSNIVLGSLDAKMKIGKTKDTFRDVLFGTESDIKFIKPFGVAVKGNRMYVTDVGRIYSFDFDNGKFNFIGANELKNPLSIAVSGEKIFVGDAATKRIIVFQSTGKSVMGFGVGELDTPAGIAVDEKRGRIIVSDSKKHSVFIYGMDGRLLRTIGKKGVNPGEFNIPYGIAVDKEGRIYVIDSANFRLQIFDENGNFLKSIGSIGTSPGNFARPKGVALDTEGHIYVLDAAFCNFQIFDFEGNILLAVGNPGRESAEFNLPSSIYIDDNDGIYIVDQLNKRVQIFQYLKEEG